MCERYENFINVIEVFDSKNRNKGVASAIVKKCMEIAKENGSYQIQAYCDVNNVASHMLWRKNKFGISPVQMETRNWQVVGSFVTYVL